MLAAARRPLCGSATRRGPPAPVVSLPRQGRSVRAARGPAWIKGGPAKRGPGIDYVGQGIPYADFPPEEEVATPPKEGRDANAERLREAKTNPIVKQSRLTSPHAVLQANLSISPEERKWAEENNRRWREEEAKSPWLRAKRWLWSHMGAQNGRWEDKDL
eukprot:TRINITY_DN47010_c0_g1_i1.p2 TRINITY_DN47010_c0_g1~~TRINITY_DN47010_c0_g1_i1.p2  ORF type:complete len:186 (+),score=45.70 TRINITY_DN47010_c0_g1_i1:80-559(+)